MSFKKIFFMLLSFLLPAAVFADGAVYEATVISQNMEGLLELINLLLALVATFFAVKLAALAQGGQMEKTWNMLALASVTFALIEIANALAGFGLVKIHGTTELFEIVFAFTLVAAFVRTKKILLKQVMGK